jgi:hypothetical protein
MKPGELLKEGVVVRHDDHGVWVGREAGQDEACPAGHNEHLVAGRRVFLSVNQAPIPPGGLHSRRGKEGKP